MNRKFYVVGSGITGCVIARELAERGNSVTVWERRSHTGGNLYDFTDKYGIHVHLYGPHIFHTKMEHVWNYVNRFCEFREYSLTCGSVMDGRCVPAPFDFQSVDTFFSGESETIKEHIRKSFGGRRSATILEMLECGDEYVRKFASFLYDRDYAPYTAKQWGIKPEEVDRTIFKRVPVLFQYGSRYFDDPWQAMPVRGYSELTGNLLSHENISVYTDFEALEHICVKEDRVFIDGNETSGTVVYTGPLDELFGCASGRLPYRSLRFEWNHDDADSFQEMPVVAYPQAEGYTRITEYKKLPYQDVKGTTYAVEYPVPYRQGEDCEPYYPVLTDESIALFERYRNMAGKVGNLVCCGRLADFKYYNMDQAVDRALSVAQRL